MAQRCGPTPYPQSSDTPYLPQDGQLPTSTDTHRRDPGPAFGALEWQLHPDTKRANQTSRGGQIRSQAGNRHTANRLARTSSFALGCTLAAAPMVVHLGASTGARSWSVRGRSQRPCYRPVAAADSRLPQTHSGTPTRERLVQTSRSATYSMVAPRHSGGRQAHSQCSQQGAGQKRSQQSSAGPA